MFTDRNIFIFTSALYKCIKNTNEIARYVKFYSFREIEHLDLLVMQKFRSS